MSLRTFHLVFIVASLLLCVLVLSWALATQTVWMAAAAGLLGAGLAAYGMTFGRRLMSDPVSDPAMSDPELGK